MKRYSSSYLRKHLFSILPGLIIVPLFVVLFGYLFAYDLKTICVNAIAFILWILIDQYGVFVEKTRASGSHDLKSDFKRNFFGVGVALVVGYIIFLLFSKVDTSAIGKSTGYFMASLSVLFYYLGRYKGLHNDTLPFGHKLFGK